MADIKKIAAIASDHGTSSITDRMQNAARDKDEFLADEKRTQSRAVDQLKPKKVQSSFLWRALAPEVAYQAQKSQGGLVRGLASAAASGAKRAAVAGLKGAGTALLDFIEPKAVRAARQWIGNRRSVARERRDDESVEAADSAAQSASTAAESAQMAANAAIKATKSKDDQTAKNVEETAISSKAVATAAKKAVQQDRKSSSKMIELLEEQFSVQNKHNRRVLELLEKGDDDDGGGGSLLGDIVSGVGVLLAGAGIGWAWLKSLRSGKKADANLAAKAVTEANAARSAEMASRVSAAESEARASKAQLKTAESRVAAAESRAAAAASNVRASTAEAASSKAASSIETAAKTHSSRISARANQALARVSTAIDGIGSTITEKSAAIRTSAADYQTRAGKLLGGVSDSVKKAAESAKTRLQAAGRSIATRLAGVELAISTESAAVKTKIDDAGRMAAASIKKAAESADKIAVDVASADKAMSTSTSKAAKSVSGLSDRIPSITDDVSKAASKVATDMDRAHTAAVRSVTELSSKAVSTADDISGTASRAAMGVDRAGAMADRSVGSLSSRANRLFTGLSGSITRLDDAVAAESATVRSHIGRIRGAAAIESATIRAAISAESAATRTRIGDLRVIVDDAGHTTGIAIRKAAETAAKAADKVAVAVADANRLASASASQASRSVSELSSKTTTIADDVSKATGKVAADMDRGSITSRRSIASLSGKVVAMADGVAETASKVATDMDRAHTAAQQSLVRAETRIGTISTRLQEGIGRIDQAMSQMAKKIDDSRVGAALRQSQPAIPLRKGGTGDRLSPVWSSSPAPTRRQVGARGGRAVAIPGSTTVNKAASVGAKALSVPAKIASVAKIGAKVLLSTPVAIVADVFIPDRELGIGTLEGDYKRAVDVAIKELPALLSSGRSSRLKLTAQSPGEVVVKLSKYVGAFYGEIPAHARQEADSGPTTPGWWQSRMQALVDHPRKVLSLAQKGGSQYARPFSMLLQANESIGQYTISKGMVDKYKRKILENPPRSPIEVIIFNWVRKNMPLRSEESVSVDSSLFSSKNITMGSAAAKSSGGLWGKIKGFFAPDPAPAIGGFTPSKGFAYAPSGSRQSGSIAVTPDAEQSRIPDGMSPTNMTQSAMNAVRQEMQAKERKRSDRTSSGRPTGFGQEGSAPPIIGTGNQQGRTIPSNVSDMGMLIALTEGEDRDLRDLVE